MKPIKEEDFELLSEIQENDMAVLEKAERIDAKIKQIVKEEYKDE